MGTILGEIMTRHGISVNQLSEAGVVYKRTFGRIKAGKGVNTQSIERVSEWLKENKPEAYRELIEEIARAIGNHKPDE